MVDVWPKQVSLASPGTKAWDAVGGAFRPEWREGPVSTRSSSTISCGRRALIRVWSRSAFDARLAAGRWTGPAREFKASRLR